MKMARLDDIAWATTFIACYYHSQCNIIGATVDSPTSDGPVIWFHNRTGRRIRLCTHYVSKNSPNGLLRVIKRIFE